MIVMDVLMPGELAGIETTHRLKRLLPKTQIVVRSEYTDNAHIGGALRAGALTYVEKDNQPEQLLKAIGGAAQGKAVLDLSLSSTPLS